MRAQAKEAGITDLEQSMPDLYNGAPSPLPFVPFLLALLPSLSSSCSSPSRSVNKLSPPIGVRVKRRVSRGCCGGQGGSRAHTRTWGRTARQSGRWLGPTRSTTTCSRLSRCPHFSSARAVLPASHTPHYLCANASHNNSSDARCLFLQLQAVPADAACGRAGGAGRRDHEDGGDVPAGAEPGGSRLRNRAQLPVLQRDPRGDGHPRRQGALPFCARSRPVVCVGAKGSARCAGKSQG